MNVFYSLLYIVFHKVYRYSEFFKIRYKGILTDDKIVTESANDVKNKSKRKKAVSDIKAWEAINDEKILAEMFNNHYVDIPENSAGVASIELGTTFDPTLDRDTVEKILKYFENHPSTIEIKKLTRTNKTFTLPKATNWGYK